MDTETILKDIEEHVGTLNNDLQKLHQAGLKVLIRTHAMVSGPELLRVRVWREENLLETKR